MHLNYVWGRFRSDQELVEIAREMNSIGRSIEKKTAGVVQWVTDIERRRKADPRGLAF